MIETIHQSHIGMWLRCGVQFENRYLNNRIHPPSVAARSGSAPHKAAHINHAQKIETHRDMALVDLLDACRDEFVHLIKDEGVFIPQDMASQKEKILNDGLNSALRATSKYSEGVAPSIRPIASEERITVDIGLGIPISGTPDVLDMYDEFGDLKIRGAAKGQRWADRDIQPSFYYLLHYKEYGCWPTGFRYHQIITLKTGVKYVPLFTTRDAYDIARLIRYIQLFIADLDAGIMRPADPDSWICSPDFCGYFGTCPYGGLRRIAA